MAWSPVVRPTGVRRAIDIGGAQAAADEGFDRLRGLAQDGAAVASSIREESAAAPAMVGDGEIAINDQTGEVMLWDGSVVKASAPTLVRLATLQSEDGTPIPQLDTSMLRPGFRRTSLRQLAANVNAVDSDSDFWGELWASFKTGLGLAASSVDAMIGNDDPSNSLARASRDLAEGQTIAQFKAGEGAWFSGIDEFISGLGKTLGNIGSSAAVALPALVAGGAVGSAAGPGGTAGGAIATTGMAVTGGLQAFGEQATDFYDTAMEAMSKLSPEELAAESPLYQRILAEQPGISHEEAMREVAIQGARRAGAGGALPGAVEAVIGGRLAGNLLAKFGFRSALAGAAKKSLPGQTASRARQFGGAAARTGAAGVGAGVSEMAETGIGQALGAQHTGIGDPTVLGNVDIREGIAASQAGFLLGGLGGRANARDDLAAALQVAGQQSPSAETAPQTAEDQPAILRRGIVGADGQAAIPVELLGGEGVAPAPPAAPPAAPAPQTVRTADPAQAELFAPVGPQPADNIDLQNMQRAEQEQTRQFARQAFAEFFGIDPNDPQQLQAAMPQLLDMADQYPEVKAVMVAAGVYPNLLEQSPESQQAQVAAAQQQFASQPATIDGAPVQSLSPVAQQGGAGNTTIASRVRGPESAQRAAVSMFVPEQVATPEPLAPPAERTPEGRPMGVAPPPLVNPEPMAPEQAQQAAQTRALRRRRAGVEPSPVDAQTPPAPAGETGVTPTTPEPAGDIAAQIEALLDPASERTSVFVAEGNEAAIPAGLPEDVMRVRRKGVGTLLTIDEAAAKTFRRGKLTDAAVQKLLGYSENKADVVAAGEPPVVVEARTPEGTVAAQQIATPRNARAAAVAVRRQARANATVATTTPQQAQAERAARRDEQVPRNARAAAVAERRAERRAEQSPAPKTARVKAALMARRDEAEVKKKSAEGLAADSAPAPRVEGEPRPAPRVDLTDRAKNTPREITSRNRKLAIPDTLVVTHGAAGSVVDLRTQAVDETLRETLRGALSGKLSAEDAKYVERVLLVMAQLDVMLDAKVAEAEDRLLALLDSSEDGRALLSAAEARTLRQKLNKRRTERAAAGLDLRGRPAGRPYDSPLLSVPLTVQEMLHFGRLVRAQARAEAKAPLQPGESVARQLLSAVFPGAAAALNSPETLRAAVEAFAQLTDEQLDARIRSGMAGLQDSPVAKRVMRGATEVARVTAQDHAKTAKKVAENTGNAEAIAATAEETPHLDPRTPESLGLKPAKGARTTSYTGDTLVKEAISTVEGWMEIMERAGTKMTGELRVMSMATANLLHPDLFPNPRAAGRFARLTEDGKPVSVLAVDWENIAADPYAIEVLAHEFGHYVSLEVYNRSDRETQQKVWEAYSGWLAAHGHQQPLELFRSHAPQLLKTLNAMADGPMTHAYAASFEEWSANHVARFLLTRPEPRSVVEKYFARIADILRKVWAGITGSDQPNVAWAEALDAWLARGAADNSVPQHAMDEGPHNAEVFGALGALGAEPANPDGMELGARATQRVTHGIAAAKEHWRQAMQRNPKGLRENAVAVASYLYNYVMRSGVGAPLREFGLSLMTLDQMVKKFEGTPVGPPLKAWATLQRKASQLANIALHGGTINVLGEARRFIGASEALERAYKLATPVRVRLELLMYETTRYGVHPDVPFGGSATFKRTVLRDGKEVEESFTRSNKHLIESEGEPLGERAIARNRRRYEKIIAEWEALSKVDPEAVAVYDLLRRAFAELHEQSLAAKRANLLKLYGDTPTPAEQATLKRVLGRIDAEHKTHRNGPYFPLGRRGNWIVTATLPAEAHFVDTQAEADTLRRDLLAMNPGASVTIDTDDDGKKIVHIFRRSVQFFGSEREADNARQAMLDELRAEYEVAGTTVEEVAAALTEKKLLGEGKGDPQTVLDVLVSKAQPKHDYFEALGDTGTFLSELRAKLRAEGSGMDPMVASAIEEAFIEAMPELSPRKSMLPRENILGASRDMLTTYAIRYHGAAHNYAQIVYGKDINDARHKIRVLKSEFAPAGKLFTVLEKSQRAIKAQMEHTFGNRVQNGLLHAASLAFLAFSPAYVLMNMMQPTMVTLPVLAGMQVTRAGKRETLGMAAAQEYLRKAYEGTLPFFGQRALSEFVDETRRLLGQKSEGKSAHDIATDMIGRFGKTDDEQRMLRSLLENGRLDFSFLDTIEDAMRDNAAERKLANVSRLGMAVPTQVEAMNRVVTALATFRLATTKEGGMGMDYAEAEQLASEVVGSTQIDYSKLNRPLLLNKQWARVILQFKMYIQGMYALFVQNAAQWATGKLSDAQSAELEAIKDVAQKNKKKAEFVAENRRQGRATLLYLMGTHGAIGGVMGLGPVAMAAKLAVAIAATAMGIDDGDDDDEWKSSDQLLTERARAMFGEKGGEVFERGLPVLLGMDVADRLGFPNLVDTKFMGVRESDDAGTRLDKWLLYSLGAPYANLRRIVKGVGAGLDDDPFTYATDGLPAGARAVAKAFRASRSGVLDRDGDTFIPREDLGWSDLAVQALGLTPAAVSRAYRARTEEKGTVARVQSAKQLLLKRWRTSTPAERKALREEIRAFNETAPKGFHITPDALSKSAAAKRARDRGEVDRNTQSVKEYLQ